MKAKNKPRIIDFQKERDKRELSQSCETCHLRESASCDEFCPLDVSSYLLKLAQRYREQDQVS